MNSRFVVILLSTASFLCAEPVEITPPDFRGAVQPQVSVAPNGRVHVVFGKDSTIFHTSSADGRSFSPPVAIATLGKLALKMRRGPRVSATDKLLTVTAISHETGMLHVWNSRDDGKTWQEGAALNTVQKSAAEGLHSLAGDGNGLVGVVWLDHRNGGMEVWSRFSQDGGLAWGAEKLVYHSPAGNVCECCLASVAISPRGEIGVMWRNWLDGSRDMYFAESRDRGATFSAAKKLGSATWKLNGCPMDGGGLAAGAPGQWLTTWRRETQVFSTDGLGSERKVADSAMQPVVAFGGGHQLLLWQQDGALMLLRGTASAERFAEKASAAAAVSGGRGVVVAWESTAGGRPRLLIDLLPNEEK